LEFDLKTYSPVPVAYELRYMILKKLRGNEDPLPDIEGREETKNDVIRAVLSGSYPYLVSREGTGKTRLAESLANLLPPVPRIKGCPYNCDPKWPKEWLCPSCRDLEEPEVEFISGKQRYSRIQGNEYTNEAKILGVKDLQAIIKGSSPADSKSFVGTGVLRGNRGVVTVDELPAIPTKVQVLFHPMLQEHKIILEEYNWVRPIDIFFVATGNPAGFSHVNRVPEPLLDRLELIPMDLPNEAIERNIMFKESFRVIDDFFTDIVKGSVVKPVKIKVTDIKRFTAVPWWIIEIIEKSSRYTRECPNIERGSSIRGTIKTLDHVYSSTEIRGGNVSSIKDASEALKLGLRGRIRIRPDLISLDEDLSEFMKRNNEVVEDVMWYAVRDVGKSVLNDVGNELNIPDLRDEIDKLLSLNSLPAFLEGFPLVKRAVDVMRWSGKWERPVLVNGLEEVLRDTPEAASQEAQLEFCFSAVEMLVNAMLATETYTFRSHEKIYVPKRLS
jgi:MoxR-like ATPase